MPRLVDRTDQRFGRLEVIGRAARSPGVWWSCRCDCGNIVTAKGGNLQSGNTRSCGCLQREEVAERQHQRRGKFRDLKSTRFGRLTVISFAGTVNGKPFWNCLCECGAMKTVMAQSLRRGLTESCGCQQREVARQLTKIATGQRYGRLVVESRTDRAGYWKCRCDCNNYIVVRSTSLLGDHTTSCGCFGQEQRIKAATTHGLSRTPAYLAMKARERLERKRELDVNWTIEMDVALRQLQLACVLCKTTEKLTIDHLLPLSKGHGLRPGNAVILCGSCNTRKFNKLLEDLPPDVAEKLVVAAGQFKTAWEART